MLETFFERSFASIAYGRAPLAGPHRFTRRSIGSPRLFTCMADFTYIKVCPGGRQQLCSANMNQWRVSPPSLTKQTIDLRLFNPAAHHV